MDRSSKLESNGINLRLNGSLFSLMEFFKESVKSLEDSSYDCFGVEVGGGGAGRFFFDFGVDFGETFYKKFQNKKN